MKSKLIWTPTIRLFHWAFVGLIGLNIFVTDPEGSLHPYTGYLVMALIGARLYVGFFGSRYELFKAMPTGLRAVLNHISDIVTKRRLGHAGHSPMGSWMVINLLLTVLIVTLSGHLMTTDRFWGEQWPEDLHKLSITWLEASGVLHICAVFLESIRTRVNLPASMITGRKELSSRDRAAKER